MPSEQRASRALCAEYPNDNPDLHRGAIWRCAALGEEASFEPPAEWAPVLVVNDGTQAHAVSDRISIGIEGIDEMPSLESLVASVLEEDSLSEESPLPESRPEPLGLVAAPRGDDDERLEDDERPEEARALDDDDLSEGGEFASDAGDHDPIEIVSELTFDAIDEQPATPDDPFSKLVSTLEEAARALGAVDSCVRTLRALFGVTRAGDLVPETAAEEALVAGGIVIRGQRGLARSGAFTGEVLAWQGILRGDSEDFSLCGATTLDEWTANVLARAIGGAARHDAIRKELRRRGVAAFGLVSVAA
jgi:hypothetical protein